MFCKILSRLAFDEHTCMLIIIYLGIHLILTATDHEDNLGIVKWREDQVGTLNVL